MKKLLLLLVLILLSAAVGYTIRPQYKSSETEIFPEVKREILRFAIVSDSSGENELLIKALSQAKGAGVNFVVGLGDWTTVGTDEQLASAKNVFDQSGFTYDLTAGDHDVWDSRDKQEEPATNFKEVFGDPNRVIERNGVRIILVDNSDIYRGISEETWEFLKTNLQPLSTSKLTFVMAHKTPFHPDSQHIMGAQSAAVAKQAKILLDTLINSNVSGFFSGDLHFFAQFKSPDGKLPITTVGAVGKERNFQGPRFAVVKVFSDYTWEVDDVEIR